MSINCALE